MPRLFDLLGDSDSKDRLAGIQRDARRKRRESSKGGRKREGIRKHGGTPGLRVPEFVALDLETTGLDAKADRIIEIGICRFVNGKEVEQYTTLVNPGRPIPPEVVALTGIRDKDVADAPAFGAVVEKTMKFIGQAPICGHQVGFDITFLGEEIRRCGYDRIKNARIDTAGLARLLAPNLTGYTLGQVSTHVGARLENAHRALDDARASGLVAVALIPRMLDIPLSIRRILADFAPRSLLKKLLVSSLSTRGTATEHAPKPVEERPGKLTPVDDVETPVDVDALAEAFGDNGLGKLIEGYQARNEQTRMAGEVADALNHNRLLAVEAGTGTGKSLAYLVPAAMAAMVTGRKVVVATHTRNLQDQLAGKDLPVVRALLGDSLRFAVLKGRANYLCRHRYRRLLRGDLGNLSPREREGMLPLIRWAEETKSGDIEEQRQFNRKWYSKIWNLIAAESHGCNGAACPLFGECFLHTARRRAQASHVVVVNHALFYSDVMIETPVLGAMGPVIFDEAHHLEACGHRSLCVVIDSHRLNGYLDSCTNLVVRLEKEADGDTARHTASDLKKKLRVVRHCGEDLHAALASWAQARGATETEYQVAVGEQALETLPETGGFRIALDDLQEGFLQLRRSVGDTEEESGSLMGDIESCLALTSQLRADLGYLAAARTEDHVFWLEGSRKRGWVKLCGVPLDIGGMLAEIWERTNQPVVFTSATLSVAETLDYYRRKVGMFGPNDDRVATAILHSPFEAAQSVRVSLTSGPEPKETEFVPFCAQTVARLHTTFHRNMLVLFTSHAMLRDVEEELRKRIDPNAAPLLSQASGASRVLLMQQFKESRGGMLLGTASFWEGVDAPGEGCELVVIPRLPFQVPTEPLAQALASRAETEFGESFYSYSVPEAVIRFRQGAGRLIRSEQDRGALVVLDKRIATKGYGKVFSRSLDGDFRRCDSEDGLLATIGEFFDNPGGSGGERYVPVDE